MGENVREFEAPVLAYFAAAIWGCCWGCVVVVSELWWK